MLSDAERDALEDIGDNIGRAMRFVDGFDLDDFEGLQKQELLKTKAARGAARGPNAAPRKGSGGEKWRKALV